MIHIKETEIKQAGADLAALVWDYRHQIDKTFLSMDEDALTISLSLKLMQGKNGVDTEAKIRFPTGIVKDFIKREGGNVQMEIPFDDPRAKFREILFRDFSEIRRRVWAVSMPWPPVVDIGMASSAPPGVVEDLRSNVVDFQNLRESYKNPILFRSFG